jgi:hypothetical protein
LSLSFLLYDVDKKKKAKNYNYYEEETGVDDDIDMDVGSDQTTLGLMMGLMILKWIACMMINNNQMRYPASSHTCHCHTCYMHFRLQINAIFT